MTASEATPAPRPRKPIVRCTARAMVVHDGHMLLIRADDPGRPWLFLPGGGCEHGENLTDACKRELLEETGIHVIVERPVFLREFIASRHKRRSKFMPEDNHALALIFLCHPDPAHYAGLPCEGIGCFPGDVDGTGAATGMVWLPMGQRPELETMPPHVGEVIASGVIPPEEAGVTWWPELD